MGSLLRNSRFQKVMNCYIFMNFVLRAIFLGIFWWLSSEMLVVYTALSLVVLPITFFINRGNDQQLVFFITLFESILFTLLTTVSYGWSSGFFLAGFAWMLLIFINASFSQTGKLIVGGLYSFFPIGLYLFSMYYQPLLSVPSYYLQGLFAINLVQGLFSFSLYGYYFEQATKSAENEILQSNQRLLSMANTDPVTNLINRRMMMNHIEDEKLKVDRGGKPFTVVMVDIDNFKSINDVYGHDGGDFVLVQLAERIKLSLRKTDLVSRWGGDEFLFLLPETRLNEGAKVAEKVRDRITKSPFVYRERDIQVTLTFGVSQCSIDVGVGSVIRKADQALYLGKELGKNRVITENMT